ncbi:MAG: ATP-binding cassette domain-containing protein [Roseburia sp.]|nr:ATP-binding cassette domain-containing protein [Roseburia sp.]
MLISFSAVDFGYGDNLIFSSVSFAVNEGERVGLVGENGAGKTTLIKLMLGKLLPDGGEVIKRNGARIGYLEQNGGYESGNTVYAEMRSVFADEISAVEKLNALNLQLSGCEYGGREYARISAAIEAMEKFVASRDGYNVDVKIKTVLNGMGFDGFYDRVIDSMSGGEKTRLRLARLLLESPDLLVLDEPTNHLDVKTLYWLEDYLASFKGAVFVVSHDRYFLDRTVSKTLEIENRRLSSYAGNYTKYKILKEERYRRELKEWEKQQEEIKKLQTYVDKNIVRATTAKSAQSRVKQLERMEVLEKPFLPPAPPKFKFTYSQQPAKEAVTVSGLNLQIGGKSLIVGGQLQILRGEKVALVGENGAGKSTLLRAIVNGGNPAITLGRYVKIAYFEQELLNLNPDNTVMQELWERHVSFTLTEVRSSLARCGLYAEDADKKVSELSGGERVKLALCVFENAGGNVLILDEPTNHLDLPARESLESALKDFDGTVIFVSHDRYFISALAERVVEIEGGKLNCYGGGYEGYKASKAREAELERERCEDARRAEYEAAKASSYRSKRERAKEAQLKAELKAVEAEIARLEAREAELNDSLSAPEVIADYKKMNGVVAEIGETREKIDRLYERYGELLD